MASPYAPQGQYFDAAYSTPYDFPLTSNANYGPSSPGGGNYMGYGEVSGDTVASRTRKLSSQGKKALQWLKGGKRSTSPMSTSPDCSQPPSPSSFVVRNVTRNPGGVSQEVMGNALPAMGGSLGVPPGGPGGGTGYGTAMSSNDGRPEAFHSHDDRGRLQRQPSQTSQRSGRFGRNRSASPARPASPGAINAGAFHSRISPGPMSNRQQAEMEETRSQRSKKSFDEVKEATLQKRVSAQSLWKQNHPQQQHETKEQDFSRMSGHERSSQRPVSQGPMPIPQQNGGNTYRSFQGDTNRWSMPVHIPPGSSMPDTIPVSDQSSPFGFPTQPMRAGVSPIGSVSPGVSPGGYMGKFGDRERHDSTDSHSPANAAARWFKGVFGRSPRADDGEDYMAGPAPRTISGEHRGIVWNMGRGGRQDDSPMSQRHMSRDPEEAEAEARKRQSMMMAASIEDEHRSRLMNQGLSTEEASHRQERSQLAAGPTVQSIPREGNRATSSFHWDPPRSRSPPGRKPAPRLSERESDAPARDGLSALENQLTPAQRIMAEARSRLGQRERLDSDVQKAQAGGQTQASHADQDDRGQKEQNVGERTRLSKDIEEARRSKASDNRHQDQRQASGGNMKPGRGPMPNEMPLPEAMQFMMGRFYRFERYVIPLVRSLESRVGDIERDNQMAQHGDGMSSSSRRDAEMDKWVAQMTSLMQTEIGQLKIASNDIRKAREVLSLAADQHVAAKTTEIGKGKDVTRDNDEATDNDAHLTVTEGSKTSTAVPEESKLPSHDANEEKDEHQRTTNISSASFNSAVRVSKGDGANAERATANASPNGRTRYTRALGQPLHEGRMTPQEESPAKKEHEQVPSLPSLDNNAGKPNVPSSLQSSIKSPDSVQSRSRGLSVDERLRGLIRTTSATSATSAKSQENPQELEAKEEENAEAASVSNAKMYFPSKSQSSEGVEKGESNLNLASRDAPRSTSPMSLQPPTRGSPGASPLIHQSTGGSITTSGHASTNLRARAQSYLQRVDASGGSPITSPKLGESAGPTLSPPSEDSKARLGHSLASRSLSGGASTLKPQSVLSARDLNAGAANNAKSRTGHSPSTSLEKTSVTQRSFKSSAPSPVPKTISDSFASSAKSSAANTPQRMSIKDRVAFFDSQAG